METLHGKKEIRPYLFVLALILLIGIYFLWGIFSALLWLLFILFLVYDWDSRIMAVFAFISLIFCLILILFGKNRWAEILAVYVYYFMVQAVVLQIIEFWRHQKLYNESKNKQK